MAYFIVGILIENDNIVGYRVVTTNTKEPYKDIPKDTLHQMLQSKDRKYGIANIVEDRVQVINTDTQNTSIKNKSINNKRLQNTGIQLVGGTSRYPKLSLSGRLLSKQKYTVISVSGNQVLLCSALGKFINTSIDEIYYNNTQLTNAKLVVKRDKIIISSLSGGELIRLPPSSMNSKLNSQNQTYTPRYKLPVYGDSLKKSYGSNLTIHGIRFNSDEHILNTLINRVYLDIRSPTLSFDGFILSDMVARMKTSSGNTANAFYMALDCLDRKPSDDIACVGVVEFYEDNQRYLILGGTSVNSSYADPLFVCQDILHIGGGIIALGVESKGRLNKDYSMICLGLSGLILLEPIKLSNKTGTQTGLFGVHGIPYNHLKTKEDVLKALTWLKTLDKSCISNGDIDYILHTAKKSKYNAILTTDISKIALNRLDLSKAKQENISASALLNISTFRFRFFKHNLIRDVYQMFRLCLDWEAYSFIESDLSICQVYPKGDKPDLSSWWNRTDIEVIWDLDDPMGLCIKDNKLGIILPLRCIGYAALEGDTPEIDMSNLGKGVLNCWNKNIKCRSLSDDILVVQYSAYLIDFDYRRLLEYYNYDLGLQRLHSKAIVKFNAKASILEHPISIDKWGYIISNHEDSHIKQLKFMRGVDVSNSSGKLTVEVTQGIEVIDRSVGWRSLYLILLYKAENFDNCVPKIVGLVDKIVIDVGGVSSVGLLERMVCYYIGLKLRLYTLVEQIGNWLEHLNFDFILSNASTILKESIQCNHPMLQLVNMDKVPDDMKIALLKKVYHLVDSPKALQILELAPISLFGCRAVDIIQSIKRGVI